MSRSYFAIASARALVIPACLALSGAAAVIAVPVTATAQVAIDIYAPAPPPPLPEYDQPPLPDEGYIWTPGYWAYGDIGYYWVPGTWAQPPEPGLLWTPGYWGFVGGRYGFNAGYWGPQVGFYGGIDYGFGYTGEGYFGGEWRGGRFAYNSAVNNFGGVHITNVYNRTVVRNVTVNRVSFNGPGGIDRRPTPQQVNFAREHHVPPTPAQVQHRDLAARNPELRNSVNHGRPAITATSRPGDFAKAPAEGARPRPEAAPGGPNAAQPRPAPRPDREPVRHTPAGNAGQEPPTGNAGQEPTPRAERPVRPAPGAERPVRAPAPVSRPETPRPAAEPRPAPAPRPPMAPHPVAPHPAAPRPPAPPHPPAAPHPDPAGHNDRR